MSGSPAASAVKTTQTAWGRSLEAAGLLGASAARCAKTIWSSTGCCDSRLRCTQSLSADEASQETHRPPSHTSRPLARRGGVEGEGEMAERRRGVRYAMRWIARSPTQAVLGVGAGGGWRWGGGGGRGLEEGERREERGERREERGGRREGREERREEGGESREEGGERGEGREGRGEKVGRVRARSRQSPWRKTAACRRWGLGCQVEGLGFTEGRD